MAKKSPVLRVLPAALALVFALGWCTPCPAAEKAAAAGAVPLSQYLGSARSAADWVAGHTEEILAKWRQTFDPENVFGYRPPGGLLEMAEISAYLFEKEKNPAYAARAKQVLLTYGDYRAAMPDWARAKRADYADGVPALPDFFTAMRFIRSYEILHRLGQLTPEENRKLEDEIAQSMEYLLRAQEWGTMNRAALRAECLAWALRALPGHPRARVWDMQRRAIGDDNWGNWEIEDASLYNGIWLYALISYAEALNKRAELWRTPEWYYYAQYYLHLMSPDGMVPDFGDAHWESNWAHYLVFFEAAAAAYQDPALKWGALTIGRKFIDFGNPANIGLACMLLDCCRWGTDAGRPAPPATLSEEVMEDVQGKKVVFRSGWGPQDTYLLLNYRDEGDGGLNFRDYLRDTIPVEEEKMTHGHADENSVSLLMSGGSVLLHDAGYRDYMPSGPFGAYRQDYFHNRLCVRPEKIFFGQKKGESRYAIREDVPGQSVLEFLRDAGSYRRVRTQKVDFLTLEDFDYSRTRVIDDNWGYSWDRVIAYVKDPEMFIVFDIFKALREEWFTLANLWHTQKVKASGDHWYRTAYEKIQANVLTAAKDLLIVFPETHYRFESVEPIKRHYQDELAIHQVTGQHFELGGTAGFVTVLIPVAGGAAPDWSGRIRAMTVNPGGAGLGVEIADAGKTVFAAVKADLRRDVARDWRRPRYTYEAGKVGFGDFDTDGDFVFARLADGRAAGEKARLDYTVVNLTRALFRGQALVEVKPSVFGLAYDGSPDGPGFGKLRYWRDEARVEPR